MSVRKTENAAVSIGPALPEHADIVYSIVQKTIGAVYPKYYPSGAVDFFSAHHTKERIIEDIAAGRVYLLKCGDRFVGTATAKDNEICRLFVLPEAQGRGFGRMLLDHVETVIGKAYDEIVLDASLPAKGIYQNRGYTETGYNRIETENGDYLCYDQMKKLLK